MTSRQHAAYFDLGVTMARGGEGEPDSVGAGGEKLATGSSARP